MPNARPVFLAAATVAALLAASTAGAQQPDSTAHADSLRADSVMRAELARIRGEPRRAADSVVVRVQPDSLHDLRVGIAGEALGDFSPRAAARAPGSRLRVGDFRLALGVTPTRRTTADLSITFRNDSTPQINTAALTWQPAARLALRAGRQAVPFGIAAPRQRVDLWFPEHPLPVRAFLGQRGIRSTGLLVTGMQGVGGVPFTLRVGVFDRFGDRIDSLHTAEPADQSLAGLAGFARLSTEWMLAGAHIALGASTISGKREQPITCVYQVTVGPVVCPQGVSGANTRMSVLGADGQLDLGALAVEGEWMRNVVGATDLPVFASSDFTAYYTGMYGTYDGAYVQALYRGPGITRFGAKVEAAQNPAVAGLNDRSVGAFIGLEPVPGGRIILSYQRRMPSAAAKQELSPAARVALDRVVLRGTFALGWIVGAVAR